MFCQSGEKYMSIQERKEEAEAVLDSAEMILETFPGHSKAAKELKGKITELEQELQDPESEKALKDLIEDIQELMDELQEEGMEEPAMGPEEGGMGPGGGFDEPEDDVPPF